MNTTSGSGLLSVSIAIGLSLAVAVSVLPASVASASTSTFEAGFEAGVDVFTSSAWGMYETSAGHDGPGLRTVMPAGQHWGASGHYEFAARGQTSPDELYWRYWIRFDEDFYIEPPNRGKLPGVGGLYNYRCLGGRPSTVDEPCFSARMLFSRDYGKNGVIGPDDSTLLGFYAYHLDSPSNRGDIWTWDPQVALLDHGRWYCVEGRVTMNTPGVRDGVLQGWVDGRLAFDKRDIAFRRKGESWMRVKSFWFDVYHGGGPSGVRNEIVFDSLAFGPERQGCDDGFTPPFRDDEGSIFEADIAWIAERGITKGCNPPANDRYCPDRAVTRGQMAAFLTRALGLTETSTAGRFADVASGSTFAADIDELATAGITKGCNPPANDRYCPDLTLTRAQMAAFLVRALNLTETSAAGNFTDVPANSTFATHINKLATAGITKGCNPPANDRYCPNDDVTRAQMAAFLRRGLG